MAFLGMAECNAKGDVNVSKFKDRIAGCGGFINITQNTHKVVFCGTFTAKGLREEIRDGKLVITHEGAVQKFIGSARLPSVLNMPINTTSRSCSSPNAVSSSSLIRA